MQRIQATLVQTTPRVQAMMDTRTRKSTKGSTSRYSVGRCSRVGRLGNCTLRTRCLHSRSCRRYKPTIIRVGLEESVERTKYLRTTVCIRRSRVSGVTAAPVWRSAIVRTTSPARITEKPFVFATDGLQSSATSLLITRANLHLKWDSIQDNNMILDRSSSNHLQPSA